MIALALVLIILMATTYRVLDRRLRRDRATSVDRWESRAFRIYTTFDPRTVGGIGCRRREDFPYAGGVKYGT